MISVTPTSRNGETPLYSPVAISQKEIVPGSLRPLTSGNTATAACFKLWEPDGNGVLSQVAYVVTDTYATVLAALTTDAAESGSEVTTNKVTSLSGASTDTQYPSAKLAYDQLALKAPLASPTFTGVPAAPTAAAGVITTQVATMAAVQNRLNYYAASTTGTDTYAATFAPVPPAYVTGMEFNVKFTITNTTTATINANSLGAKTLKKTDGATNLSASDLVVGMVYRLFYDGTNMIVMNL